MKRLLFLLGLLMPTASFAPPYSIDWYKVAGGGGTCTGGTYSLSGTIGQHDASGAMTGGNDSVTGGFWSFASVVQTIGAPSLTITLSGSNLLVSWSSPPSGWTLQQNSNLATADWTTFTGIVSSNGTTLSMTISPAPGALFFRLARP